MVSLCRASTAPFLGPSRFGGPACSTLRYSAHEGSWHWGNMVQRYPHETNLISFLYWLSTQTHMKRGGMKNLRIVSTLWPKQLKRCPKRVLACSRRPRNRRPCPPGGRRERTSRLCPPSKGEVDSADMENNRAMCTPLKTSAVVSLRVTVRERERESKLTFSYRSLFSPQNDTTKESSALWRADTCIYVRSIEWVGKTTSLNARCGGRAYGEKPTTFASVC